MIREDDEVRGVEHIALSKAGHEASQGSVNCHHGLIYLERIRPVAVARDIDLLEVQRHEAGPLIWWEVQPRQHLVDTVVGWNARIEKLPVGGSNTTNLSLRSRVENGSCA